MSGKNLLPMKELASLLNGLGCKNTKTYIQSGNVVLESGSSSTVLQKSIAAEILAKRGFEVAVLALPIAKFKTAASDCPFETTEGKLLHYFFAASVPKIANTELLASLCADSEKYELKGAVFYLYAPDGIGRSKLAAKVEKALGVPTTARNHNTVQKLLELAG